MVITVAFDVYGTLIDTQGIVTALGARMGDRAAEFSRAWREKQLEYTFRRGLMQNYQDFSVCVRDAFDYTNSSFGSPFGQEERTYLLAAYEKLPAFPDAKGGLAAVRQDGHRLFAFSNGRADTVAALLKNARLLSYFNDIVSVDDMKSFKPNPGVYAHFLRQAGAAGASAWLVSSNPFDVIGAVSAGMRAAWIKRSPDALFDSWGIEPSLVVPGLGELAEGIRRQTA
ncbi:MAG: haloacid dehalogenase type II [Proteobacteria bacterium]|nr:haloacid dehalogenase type II [Pseudomonadota bacterium]